MIKRELHRRPIYECRCDKRLKVKGEGSTRLDYTVLCHGGLEHLKYGTSFVYYESIKRQIKIKPINECRCDERLKTKGEESTHLVYTGLFGELEHLKIKTRLIDEKFASVMGECVI